MITCLVRKTVLRFPGKTSSFVWLAGPFSSSVAPTNLPIFLPARVEAAEIQYAWQRHAPPHSLGYDHDLQVGSITDKPAIMAAAARVFPAPKTPLMGQSAVFRVWGFEWKKSHAIFPGEREPLFAASVKLLQFALRASSASAYAKELTEDEEALLLAIRPLVANPDCHFLAVLTALVQSILEGRTSGAML